MAQRKRQLNGFHYDVTTAEDIAREDEYSSADYDSDEQHSVAFGDSTDNETTDDEYELEGLHGTCVQ